MGDLRDPRWIHLKGVLFLAIGVVASGLLMLDHPDLRTATLLTLAVWGFSRAYYYAFYVVEKYVDPSFRFSGLGSFVNYLLRRRDRRS